MRKKSMGLCKRVLSISLAAALIVTSLQVTVNPAAVKEAEAAAVDENYDTKDLIDEKYVKDPEVLRYYRILANAKKKGKVSEVSGKPASEVLDDFTSSEYTDPNVGLAQLIDYSGKINFSGLRIGNVSGIGWARSAEEIDLSGADFSTPLKEVPANEFASCEQLVKIILPDTVTKIGNNAFESCRALKTLMIGSGVENVVDLTKVDEVGASAFKGCSAVEAVTFSPYGTRSTELKIGENAFTSCVSLKEIEIPVKKAENIGANAFASCAKLERAGLQNELTYLSNSLFSGAGMDTDGITMYIIGLADGERRLPENITYIGNSCFHGANLTGLDLSKCTKLTTINERAFAASHWTRFINTLESVVLPENLRKLGERSFETSEVIKIRIPESCSEIGESAFARSSLMEISLPKSLKKIESRTFEDCDLLTGTNIQIADGSQLEEIGDEAFYGSQALDTTAFLKNCTKLTTIGEKAFASCSVFAKNAGGGELKNLYGASYAKFGLREIILPDCVKTIGKEVFANNYALQTADLGAGVTVIPERAFYNEGNQKAASVLEKVTVSAGLTDIEKEAFANQSKLHTIGYKDGSEEKVEDGVVQFKEGLLTIGEKAFSGCGMQSTFSVQAVRIYVSKGKIGDSYTAGTSKFLIYDYENGSMDNNFCRECYINEEDVITRAVLEAEGVLNSSGNLTEQGREKYDEVSIIAKEVRVTCHYDTAQTTGAKQLTLEVYDNMYDTVTNTYRERFYNEDSNPCRKWYIAEENKDDVKKEQGTGGRTVWCKVSGSAVPNVQVVGSTNVSLPNYSYSFGIRDVKLPDSVIDDSLGAGAFENCINLNEVRLSDNLKVIKDNTFSGCGADIKNPYNGNADARYYDYAGLHTVEIPDGIEEIGANAFKGCCNLIFPQNAAAGPFGTSVLSIGDSAFADCYSLDSIRFPSSLTSIGREAFARCAEKEMKASEVIDNAEGSTLKYSYFKNLESYGTKTVKKGLNKIEFSAATRLETVGAGAFKQTNVEGVNLAKSPLVQIPDSLFEQCTWLKSITFQNDTESLGSNVLKDVISLETVTLPASATMKSNTISGAFGKNCSINRADPSIVLEYDKVETVIIPVGSSKRLPINVFNKDNVVGDPAPAIEVDTGDRDEHNRYRNIIGKENAYNGVYAEFVLSDEKDRNAPCSFILYGTDYAPEMTVRVVANTYYKECNFNHGMISNYTLSFKVSVQEQPTEKLDLSVKEEDPYFKRNPSMYVVKGTDKILYVPNGQDPATKGVTLQANLEPVDTTDDVVWTSSNPGLVEISDVVYEKGSGVTTAVIKTKEIGNAEITVQSGQKKDTIHVYSVIPVAGSNGLTCSTGGTILNQDLKPNSENEPYGLAVGDADQFAIKLDYGKTDYTDDQIASYGEKLEFVSSDPSVISVNPDGTFKAQKEGTAVITVTALGSGSKLQFYFNVDNEFNYAPTSIQVSGDTVVVDDKGNQQVSVNVDETVSLSAKVVPERASQEVTWQVTNGNDIISVDDKGTVTGLKRGTGKVVAVSKEKETVKSKEITVTVKSPAKEFYILCGDVTLEKKGNKKTISKVTSMTNTSGFYISPVDSTDGIEWTSSNPAVFTVTSNTQSVTLTAVGSGTGILTGRTESGLSASITVTVPIEKISVTGIEVDKEITLNVKKTHQLSPKILPENANETVTFTYTSSDEKIASVSASGLITAVAPGTATITAKTNTNKSATCRVTVNSPATKLKALMKNRPSASKIYMAKGQTASLRVDKTPVNSTDTLKYKSNKPKIATVDANGSIAAKKKGTAKITVTATSKKKATITIIVSKKAVSAKKVVVKAPKTIKRGKKGQLKVSLKPAKSTDTLSFATSNAAIATVDECGYVTGVKKGTVKITVTAASGKKATKKIKIK